MMLIVAARAHAGTVTTLDGKSFEGDVRLDAQGSVIVSPKTGSKARVDLANLLRASFGKPNEERPLIRGIVLTTGEAFAADAITRLDDTAVRFVRPGGIAGTIPNADVAIVVFRPVSPEVIQKLPQGHGGVVLENGDFVDGDLTGFADSQIRISSVLFGPQSFDVTRQARAVVLHDAAAPEADSVVRLMDGSVLLGKSVSVRDGNLNVDDARLGPVQASPANLLEIRLGGGAFQPLDALVPEKANAADFALERTTVSLPMSLLGRPSDHGIGQRAGSSITWNLDGKYQSFMARAGVPDGLVPLRRLQFIVLADGKEVYRSSPRSSIDDPASIAAGLASAKTLTLRIDGAPPDAAAAAGLWLDPILVKNRSH